MIDDLKKYLIYDIIKTISISTDPIYFKIGRDSKKTYTNISIVLTNGVNIDLLCTEYDYHKQIMDVIYNNDIRIIRKIKINKIISRV